MGSLIIDKWLHLTFYDSCNYSSIVIWAKIRSPWSHSSHILPRRMSPSTLKTFWKVRNLTFRPHTKRKNDQFDKIQVFIEFVDIKIVVQHHQKDRLIIQTREIRNSKLHAPSTKSHTRPFCALLSNCEVDNRSHLRPYLEEYVNEVQHDFKIFQQL